MTPEKQRPDINPMPRFELLPPRIHPLELAVSGVSRALHFVFDRVRQAPLHMSNHLRQPIEGVDEMLLDDPGIIHLPPGKPYTYPGEE